MKTIVSEKRNNLIEKAITLFKNHGCISVTMDDLAKTAGVSKKTVYQFFGNKAELVESVIDVLIERFNALIISNKSRSTDPVEELFLQQGLFKEWINLRSVLDSVMLNRFPRALKAFDAFKTGFLKLHIQSNLSQGIVEGYYLPDLNFALVADIFITGASRIIFDRRITFEEASNTLLLYINGVTTVKGRLLVETYKMDYFK